MGANLARQVNVPDSTTVPSLRRVGDGGAYRRWPVAPSAGPRRDRKPQTFFGSVGTEMSPSTIFCFDVSSFEVISSGMASV